MNINADTKIIPIFGDPINHSLSPLIQNTWLKDKKINYVYVAFCVKNKDLKQATDAIRLFGMPGANITVPHKIEIMKYIDKIDKSAQIIGSVNTIVNKDGKLTGYNTDWLGFSQDLKDKNISLKNKNICVVGAGGGSKAILYALSKLKVKKILLTSKNYFDTPENISKQYKNIEILDLDKMSNVLFDKIDCIVNASTCGMDIKDKLPFDIKNHKKNLIIYDLIYNKNTPFKQFAAKNKLKYVSGIGMLVQQGASGFQMWTGKKPNIKQATELVKK
ncbi:MAG: shikimate dehydrogenase [Endomicrobiaceae bacterium]|nr:shikimate dehydrogenase [Endomicrobiaceae bacterium]MDD4166823.1 shikimate dehydrogenase [Endomicrobiaceae bacterium]